MTLTAKECHFLLDVDELSVPKTQGWKTRLLETFYYRWIIPQFPILVLALFASVNIGLCFHIRVEPYHIRNAAWGGESFVKAYDGLKQLFPDYVLLQSFCSEFIGTILAGRLHRREMFFLLRSRCWCLIDFKRFIPATRTLVQGIGIDQIFRVLFFLKSSTDAYMFFFTRSYGLLVLIRTVVQLSAAEEFACISYGQNVFVGLSMVG